MKQQRILREVVEQRRRRLAGRAAGQMARVVLDAGAEAHLGQHLEVVERALLQALGFEQPFFARDRIRDAPSVRRGYSRTAISIRSEVVT